MIDLFVRVRFLVVVSKTSRHGRLIESIPDLNGNEHRKSFQTEPSKAIVKSVVSEVGSPMKSFRPNAVSSITNQKMSYLPDRS